MQDTGLVESQGDTEERRVIPVLLTRNGAHPLESRWQLPTLYEKRRAGARTKKDQIAARKGRRLWRWRNCGC